MLGDGPGNRRCLPVVPLPGRTPSNAVEDVLLLPDLFFDRYALSTVIFEPLPLDSGPLGPSN